MKNHALKLRMVIALLASVVWVPSPSAASTTVKIRFGVGIGAEAAGQPIPIEPACTVWVAAGANGASILRAARARGCIRSFSTWSWSPGHNPGSYVHCIERRCENPAGAGPDAVPLYWTYWGVYENGRLNYDYTNLGLDWVRANQRDRFVFTLFYYANTLICPCI